MLLTFIATSSESEEQGGLLNFQRKIVVPKPKPLTKVFSKFGFTIVPEPLTKIHCPAPTAGVFPARVAEFPQIFWSIPALETVGIVETLIVTVEEEEGQIPFVTVHLKTFDPAPNPIIWEEGELGVTKVPKPEILTHNPVPVSGKLALIIVVEAQIV